MGTSGAERRKYARIAIEDLICFAPLDQRQLLAVSKDVSASGIRFEVIGCEIDVGQVLRITFNIDEHTLEGVGRVVWSTDLDPLTTDVGIEFLEIAPEAQGLLQALSEGSPGD